MASTLRTVYSGAHSAKSSNFLNILTLFAFLVLPIIGYIDYVTESKLNCLPFYIVIVGFVSWSSSSFTTSMWCVLCNAMTMIASDLSAQMAIYHDVSVLYTLNTNTAFVYANLIMELFLLLLVSKSISDISDILVQENQLSHIDFLIGCPNRRYLFSSLRIEMDKSIRNKTPFSVVYIDVDNFKTVNDEQGHSEGDRLLKTVYITANRCLRSSDVFARLGGDEFACIFPQVGTDTIKVIVDKLVLYLNSEMRRNKWPVSFSIGALTCKNVHNQTVDSVMSKADLTMYKAKHTGKNKVCYDLLDDYLQEDHSYSHSVNTSNSVISTSKQKTPTPLRVVE